MPGTVGVYVPVLIARGRPAAAGLPLGVACALLVVGGGLYAWCVWNFALLGQGTPAPIDAPKALVIRGPYRFTRNPMYAGVLMVILGWAVLFRAPVLGGYALGVACCFHLFIVLYEEPHLRGVFGREFDDYTTRVGRWWPRVKRRT